MNHHVTRNATHPAAYESDVAGTLNNLGNVLRALGERDAARKAYEEAYRSKRKRLRTVG